MSVLGLCDDGFYAERLRQRGVSVLTVFPTNLTHNRLRALASLILHWPIALFKVWRWKPQVIHTWMYVADLWGGAIGRILRIPVIWGIFSGSTNPRFYSRPTYLLLRVCGFLSRSIPTVIVSCSAYGRRSHGQIGYPPNKIFYVPTGFNCHNKRNSRVVSDVRTNLTPRSQITLGMLGRISREKEHRLLLEGFRRAIDEGYDLRLMLAGGVGLQLGSSPLESEIARLDLVSRVTLLGRVGDIKEFFSQIELFVLLSSSEGFPTVLGEAMAHGCPCIASDVGDAKILLGDKDQISRSGDVEDFVQTLGRMAALSQEDRCLIGHRNSARVSRLFTLDSMYQRYSGIYQSVLALPEIKG